ASGKNPRMTGSTVLVESAQQIQPATAANTQVAIPSTSTARRPSLAWGFSACSKRNLRLLIALASIMISNTPHSTARTAGLVMPSVCSNTRHIEWIVNAEPMMAAKNTNTRWIRDFVLYHRRRVTVHTTPAATAITAIVVVIKTNSRYRSADAKIVETQSPSLTTVLVVSGVGAIVIHGSGAGFPSIGFPPLAAGTSGV